MSQILLEIRQPKPSETLVENVPVKEGKNISECFGETSNESKQPALKWTDIIGLSWIFMDPLEEDWSF